MEKPEIYGKYLFIERISVGGMAEVFKAITVGLSGFKKVLAIKRVLPHIAEDEDFVRMFVDEANIAGQLHHANIAQIYDLGRVADTTFIAMEYVQGRDLRAIFDRIKKKQTDIPVPLAAYIGSQVLAALDYAHRKTDYLNTPLHIVHRDVSPPNVLLSFGGEVKIIDFGIAKAAKKASKTQAGVLKGKFGYMSPEQVRGMPVDGRSDVFSVGIVLWEMLTKKRLFVGETDFATLEKVRGMEIEKPSVHNPKVTPEIDAIVMQALQRELEKRFPSAQHMQRELQRYLYSLPTLYGEREASDWMAQAFPEEIAESAARMRAIEELDLAYYGIDPDELVNAQIHSLKAEKVRAKPKEAEEPYEAAGQGSALTRWPVLAATLGALLLVLTLLGGYVLAHSPSRSALIGREGPKATLTVLANVEGASLRYHDRELCQTPCRIPDFPPGAQTLEVAKEGLLSDTLNVALKEGESQTLNAALYKPGEVSGVLLVRSKPSGAKVQIEGTTDSCTSPCALKNIGAGVTHKITLNLPGFSPKTIDLTLKRNEFRSEIVTLKPETPTLFLSTEPPGAAVFIDGKDTGRQTPLRLDHLTAGKALALRFVLAGHRVQELSVSPGIEEEQRVEIELENTTGKPQATPATASGSPQGWLNIFSDPPAMVYIDGQSTGRRAPPA